MNLILNIISFALSKMGVGDAVNNAAAKSPRPSKIYMKRVVFYVACFFVVWALLDAESLAVRLEMAAEVLPFWFKGALASIFSGVWL